MLETVKFAGQIAIWTVGLTMTYPAPMTNVARLSKLTTAIIFFFSNLFIKYV
jgi:hypothetical protein